MLEITTITAKEKDYINEPNGTGKKVIEFTEHDKFLAQKAHEYYLQREIEIKKYLKDLKENDMNWITKILKAILQGLISLGMIEVALDFLEEAAKKSNTKIDDTLLQVIRAILVIVGMADKDDPDYKSLEDLVKQLFGTK